MTTGIRAAIAAAEAARPPITITDRDRERLERCIARALDTRASAEVEDLEVELARAAIVSPAAIAGDVVTLSTSVVVEDRETGVRRTITVVLPEHADYEQGRVSVLAPVGAAVIGLRVGDEIDWPLANGRYTTLRVVELVFQPEAAAENAH